MAFPTIPTVGASRVVTGVQTGTSGTRTFPSLTGLTKNAGDMLIAIIACYQNSSGAGAPGGTVFSAWGASFTEFCDQMTTNASTMAVGMAYKISDGTETGTFTVTQAATPTGEAAFILLSIAGASQTSAPEVTTIVDGTASAADPPNLSPSWGSEDTLWFQLACNGETSLAGSFTGVTAMTALSDFAATAISSDSIGGVNAAVGFAQLASPSNNLATATVDTSNARNSNITVAVRQFIPPLILEQGYVDHANPGML